MEKIIIEIGGNQGTDTVKYAEHCDKLFVFEPVPLLAERLRDKFKDNTKVQIIQSAVSNKTENNVKFGISGPDYTHGAGCSSLNEFNPNIRNEWGGRDDFKHMEYIDVTTVTLRDFIHAHNIKEVEYLHIDAQGSDLKVLQSLEDMVGRIKAGRCEAANKVNLYKDVNNNVYSIIQWLGNNGFKIVALNNHHNELITIEDLPHSTEEVDIHFQRI
jgi:FkbM family methyltransferase